MTDHRPPLAADMLAQYRATATPEFKAQVDAFKSMSLAERDELMFYMVGYMANQYAALMQMLQGARPPSITPASGPHGRAN